MPEPKRVDDVELWLSYEPAHEVPGTDMVCICDAECQVVCYAHKDDAELVVRMLTVGCAVMQDRNHTEMVEAIERQARRWLV